MRPTMTLELFFYTLRARWRAFALVLAATVISAALVSLLMPKTYRATASVIADVRDEQSLSNTQRILFNPQERLGYLQTQVDVITSQKVARMVVNELKLAENPKAIEEYAKVRDKGTIEDWLVDGMLEKLKVDISQSSIIRVSYLSRDKEQSARVANAFAKAYLDTMLELRVEPTRQAAVWFDDQLKVLRTNLQRAQATLTEYQRQKGIVSADERGDTDTQRLTELALQLVRAQDQSTDWRTRERHARDALALLGSAEQVPDVLNNPSVQKLNNDLVASEARLKDISTQYGPAHPTYQRVQSEITALRAAIDSQGRKVVAGVEGARRQSQQRESELRQAMLAQRDQLLQRKVNRNELAVLTADVETAQRTYDVAMQRFVVSQVESRANQTNATMLSPALVPLKPWRPRIALNLTLALLAGALLGIGVVIAGETVDRRVRVGSDLDFGPSAPLLAVFNARPRTARSLLPGRAGGVRALTAEGSAS